MEENTALITSQTDEEFITALENIDSSSPLMKFVKLGSGIASLAVATGSIIPLVLFTNSYAERIYGKNETGLIDWAKGSSGFANEAICIGSTYLLLTQVTRLLPRFMRELQHSPSRQNKLKVLAAFGILAVNVGAFFSTLQFAFESNHDLAQDHWSKHLISFSFWAQMIGNSVLVLRSTVSKSLPYGMPKHTALAQFTKKELLKKLYQCLDERMPESTDPSTLRILLCSSPLLLTTLIYAGASGQSAYEGANTLTGSQSTAVFSAVAMGISKFLLLGDSAWRTVKDFLQAKLTWRNAVPAVLLLAGGIWNTWFSAAWITKEHLLGLILTNETLDLILSGIIGAGAALPINARDSYNLTRKLLIETKLLLSKKPEDLKVALRKAISVVERMEDADILSLLTEGQISIYLDRPLADWAANSGVLFDFRAENLRDKKAGIMAKIGQFAAPRGEFSGPEAPMHGVDTPPGSAPSTPPQTPPTQKRERN